MSKVTINPDEKLSRTISKVQLSIISETSAIIEQYFSLYNFELRHKMTLNSRIIHSFNWIFHLRPNEETNKLNEH